MFGWFKRKTVEQRIAELNENITRAFLKVKSDVEHANNWLKYLNFKNHELENKLKYQQNLGQKDLEALKAWIYHLNSQTTSLSKDVLEIKALIASLKQENSQLAKKLDKIEQLSIQEKKLLETSTINPRTALSTPKLHRVTQNDTQLHSLNDMSSSGRKIISLLYDSEKPLTYTAISAALSLNYGTVKNIIYQLRKKDFAVEDQTNTFGEKEFFLSAKQKIELSGR